jgi:Na+/melibiose symporter-like transporter
VYGLISLFVSIFVSGNNQMDPQTIAVLTITCFITALFGLLTVWSYFKTRQARKAHETPRPQTEKPQTKEPPSQAEKLQAEEA